MAIFVINEWIWHDLSGENGPPAQTETLKALTRLAERRHRIVVVEGSPFDRKAWALCKKGDRLVVQAVVRDYIKSVRLDSDRCILLRREDMAALPAELASATKADDHYLVQSLFKVEGAVLVTTDSDLRSALVKAGRTCLTREEFLTAHL